jgi:hypothetical protein
MRDSVSGGDTVCGIVGIRDLHGRGCAAVSVHGRPEAAGELRAYQLKKARCAAGARQTADAERPNPSGKRSFRGSV